MQKTVQTIARVMSFAVFMSLSVGGVSAREAKDAESLPHRDHKPLGWPGVYLGLLPCTDCVGIKTTLALNKNGTYLAITQYAGKSEREFTEKGKFEWSETGNVITLTPRSGDGSRMYAVEADRLIQLDARGNRVTGKLADRYILRRKDMSKTGPSDSGHGGH